MDKLRALMEQVGLLFCRRRAKAEMDEEMKHHLDMEIQGNLRAGMKPREARRQALLSFGGMDWFAERVREEWWGAWIEDLMRDLRFGTRNLLRRPAFTVAAVATLSLGIGMSTTMFALVDSILLRPLPGSNTEGVVYLELRSDDGRMSASPTPQFLRVLRDNTSAFARVEAYTTEDLTFTVNGEPVRARGARASTGFFSFLGVMPALGRTFLPDDGGTGSAVVVLSHSLWVQRFGEDVNVLGRTVSISGRPYQIVGVLPKDFRVDSRDPALLWSPEEPGQDLYAEGVPVDGALAKLADGVSREAAQAEVDAVLRNNPLDPMGGMGWVGRVRTPVDLLDPTLVRAILILQAAAVLVLLIGCGNLANLLLAQGETRAREFALRASLGAGRWRLIRQLLAESLLLGIAGGTGGILLTLWALGLLPSLLPPGYPGFAVHGGVFLFAATAALFSVSAVGLFPALKGSRRRLHEVLKGDVAVRRGFLGRVATRQLLVTAEIAMTVLVLVSAGVLIKSFAGLMGMDTGFDRRDLLTLRLNLPAETYEDAASQRAFFDRLEEGIQRGLPPQLASATVTGGFVRDLGAAFSPLTVDGAEEKKDARQLIVTWGVAPGYFKLMGVPVLGGRGFSDEDGQGGEKVVVINETVARRYFPNMEPVGSRLKMYNDWYRVVGVAGSIRLPDLARNGVGDLQLYFPFRQDPGDAITIIARVRGGRSAAIDALKQIVWRIDRSLPIREVAFVDDLLAESLAQQRSNALLMVFFGVTALGLGAVGVYGVVAYSVNRRIPEMGIRLALGASSRGVMARMVLDGMRTVGVGAALGVGAVFASGTVLSKLLYQVDPSDPWVFLQVLLVVALVSVLSSWLPARRVAGSAPLDSLKNE